MWLLAGASLAALDPSAKAACPGNNSPISIVANAGDSCVVSGDYQAEQGTAMQASGNAEQPATIDWTNGVDPETHDPSLATISTPSAAPAVAALDYGDITLQPTFIYGLVTTTSDNAPGLFAAGTQATITASGLIVTTGDPEVGTGEFSYGIQAMSGGSVSFDGGAVTTYGPNAAAVLATTGEGGLVGSVTLTGGTTVETSGDNSAGLMVAGAGSSVNATDVSVKTNGIGSAAAYNGYSADVSSGGAMTLSQSTFVTFGDSSDGVVTNSGGQTTVTGGSVTTYGDNALGLWASGSLAGTPSKITATQTTIETNGMYSVGALADTGASIALSGGSVTTAGDYALGLQSSGTGSSITAQDGTTVSTSGAYAHGAQADSGGSLTLNGGSIVDLRRLCKRPAVQRLGLQHHDDQRDLDLDDRIIRKWRRGKRRRRIAWRRLDHHPWPRQHRRQRRLGPGHDEWRLRHDLREWIRRGVRSERRRRDPACDKCRRHHVRDDRFGLLQYWAHREWRNSDIHWGLHYDQWRERDRRVSNRIFRRASGRREHLDLWRDEGRHTGGRRSWTECFRRRRLAQRQWNHSDDKRRRQRG